MIPILDSKRQYATIGNEIEKAVCEVLRSGSYILGPNVKALEVELAKYIGCNYTVSLNSGTDALHLALRALDIGPGDEVITTAFTFVATTEAIGIVGATPVFADINPDTFNIDPKEIEKRITPKTKAIIPVHLYGQPCDMGAIMDIAKRHNLYVIEDCCQAIGAEYKGQKVGTFGDIATLSFYPAHHITMGEGGAVLTNNAVLKKAMESIRDWGRDCWCPPGCDNTCKQRFTQKLGDLPEGYDHKYTYSHLGYNLKITDMQAACGVAQLRKVNKFIAKRKENFKKIKDKLEKFSEYLILPKAQENSEPSWFGFLISVKPDAPFTRNDLVKYLNENKIGTRLLFAGNIVKQPYMIGRNYRIVGELTNSDFIMNNTFWIGVYPGIDDSMIDYVYYIIEEFIKNRR